MNGETASVPDFDYVVVGSGAGGGPLAANLAKAGHRVLLLEAGGAAEPYNYQVPVFHPFATEDDSLKWDFFVRHYADDERQRRDRKFTEKLNGVGKNGVLYPRAGTLGGCTAHNALITVYPHESDWDDIAKDMDDPSWSSDNMRKYFERLDNCRYRPVRRFFHKISGWNPTRHGFEGWLSSSKADPRLVFRDKKLLKFVAKSAFTAFRRLGNPLDRLKQGLRSHLDPNDWRLVKKSAEGIRFAPLATNGGNRVGTREYIRQVQSEFPDNMSVRTNCLVTRVLFDDDNRAIGVEYLEGDHLYRADPKAKEDEDAGTRREVYVSKEVILSGGAFNTPQLLKLSGVGPTEELEKHGIELRVHLPGVGENLQDRYEVGVVNRMKENFALIEGALRPPGPGESPSDDFREWQNGEGPYTTNGAVLAVIKKSEARREANKPDPDLFIFALPSEFTGYYPGYSKPIRDKRNYLTWAVLKAHTNNTAGRVTLRSSNPRDVPEINFNYFDEDPNGEDLKAVVEGVKFVRRMTDSVSDLIEEEEAPGLSEELEEFVKYQSWGHHASCTCKIGCEDDEMAVLDSNFRVYGTRNLRVVDASVFPRIPGFFIVSSVYMISEKASDVILADAGAILEGAKEQEHIDRIISLQQGKLIKDYQGTRSLRDTHPKSNGLIRAEFVVGSDLPPELRVGLFKEPRTYKAWMRFSNAAPEVTPDYAEDFRGLAIKLFGVEGEKLLDDELYTHDFLFNATDVFFAGNPKDFRDFFNTLINGKATKLITRLLNPMIGRRIGLLLGYFLTRGTFRHLKNSVRGLQQFAHPLEINWFSVAPYAFGPKAVKYSVRASEGSGHRPSEIPENPSADYLTDAMRRTLKDGEFSLDFMIQFQADPKKMPIDDTTVPWDEGRSPFIKVATIRIPSQEFDSQEQRDFDDNLSFNPWHCLPEHRPLGSINRARRQVMLAMSDLRLERNKVTRVEPTGDERF